MTRTEAERTGTGAASRTPRVRSIRRAGRLWWLGFIGFLPLRVEGAGFLHIFLLFFLTPLALDVFAWVRNRRRAEFRSDGQAPSVDIPLPGPAQAVGAVRFMLRYHLSTLLMLLNPFQLAQVVRQLRGSAAAERRAARGSRDTGQTRLPVGYRLPFAGEWLVVNGGITPETSHSWEMLSQRYAYDFVIADGAGRRHRGDGTVKEHYFCYGEPVLAVADGTVVDVRDGIRDAPWVGTGWVDWLCRDAGGNAVTIRHAEGEYSYSAHLIPGSIVVRPGEQVRRGQRIGMCGHSGHSTEPHLHFQLQDHRDFDSAVGLPIAFSECRVNGEPAGAEVHPQGGMRVESMPAPAELAMEAS
jgi:murein DD-endopeptidase MepM/ murein hydrolase activator NlpD